MVMVLCAAVDRRGDRGRGPPVTTGGSTRWPPHRLHRQLRQRGGLRHRGRAGPGRHRQPGAGGRQATRPCGAGPTCRSTPPSTPTATSTTSSAWRRYEEEARRRRGPPTASCPRAGAGPLRPLQAHRRLQRRHQRPRSSSCRASGGRPVPLPRRDLPAAPRRRRRRRALRAAPRQGRDRRPHLGVAPRPPTLCTGDLFIWASPNCGNPQKVQRYPASGRWRCARWRRSAPSCCCPATAGRSPAPTACTRRSPTRRTCSTTSVDETLALMNAGARLDEIVHTVRPPPTCWTGPTCGRCTTSPSSSSATSGGCTAAGTTATRPT